MFERGKKNVHSRTDNALRIPDLWDNFAPVGQPVFPVTVSTHREDILSVTATLCAFVRPYFESCSLS